MWYSTGRPHRVPASETILDAQFVSSWSLVENESQRKEGDNGMKEAKFRLWNISL